MFSIEIHPASVYLAFFSTTSVLKASSPPPVVEMFPFFDKHPLESSIDAFCLYFLGSQNIFDTPITFHTVNDFLIWGFKLGSNV
jgi:hypothetical protein